MCLPTVENKRDFRPTYPNFFWYVSGNTTIFIFGLMRRDNSTVVWSQAQNVKGGGLCTGSAPLSRKNLPATETNTEENRSGTRMDTFQETGLMQEVSQSQSDTDSPNVDILNPKTVCRVGCWNVRTLYQTGKIAQVIQEMENYSLEILGICETRWTGCELRNLATGHHIIYSGRNDEHHSRGVGLITNKKTKKCLIGWKPVNDRIITARFHSKYTKLTIIVCYSPTEDVDKEEKERFYE